MAAEVVFKDLGVTKYKEAWDYQEKLLQENVAVKTALRHQQDHPADNFIPQSTTHYLLFTEHEPVFTLGKSGHMENLLFNEAHLQKLGIDFFKINRGGDITFHGPQQLVGYPILDLEKFYTDIGKYLRNLEEVIIKTLAHYGLKGERSPGETGVWLEPDKKGRERKICAMGVRSSRWITMHGFALNVNTDLDYFNMIVPCGIEGKQVTSLQKELGHKLSFDEVKQVVKEKFQQVFDITYI